MGVTEQMRDTVDVGTDAEPEIAPVGQWRAIVVGAVADHCVHRVAVALGVVETLHDQHHGGVAGRAGIVGGDEVGRHSMGGVARQVDGADHGRVDLADPERAHRDIDGVETAVFLGAHREARPGEVVLAVQPVGDQVGHRAEDFRRTEHRCEHLTGPCHPFRAIATFACQRGDSPPDSKTCRLRIGSHADIHARPIWREGAGLVERLLGDLEHRELLAQGGLQILRRKPLRREPQFDVGHAAETVCVETRRRTDDRIGERCASDRRRRSDTKTDDGNGIGRSTWRADLTEQHRCRGGFLDDQVGVVAAEAECRDAGPEDTIVGIAASP